MPKTFYITTAIDYTNSAPHIGHAYEKVLADVIARYHRLKGEEVFFLTGVDQHGQKVQQSAAKAGIPPAQFVRGITQQFRTLWERLDVSNTGWAETTAPLHTNCVRSILEWLWEDKDPRTGTSRWLYKKSERGWYSVRQEQFLTDREQNADGTFAAKWHPVEEREEENFYFRLKDQRRWLYHFIKHRTESGRPFVEPETRVSALLNAVQKIDSDLCISRPETRLAWGIPFPESFGRGFVTYVWLDALVNYISFAGYNPFTNEAPPTFDVISDQIAYHGSAENSDSSFWSLWPALHAIGKDILIPAHGIYWPSILHALGFTDDQMPTLLVHGWWNVAGDKMSKSAGNVVDPNILANKYGVEALRYYLVSDISLGRDAEFSEERLVERHNADLANKLGNLINRTLTMADKYRQRKLRWANRNWRPPSDDAEAQQRIENAIREKNLIPLTLTVPNLQFEAEKCIAVVTSNMDNFRVSEGLEFIRRFTIFCNEMTEIIAPWVHWKNADAQDMVDDILYGLAESLRIVAILVSPALPKAAVAIFDQLDPERKLTRDFRLVNAKWGGLPDGHVVGKPVPLFPRIER